MIKHIMYKVEEFFLSNAAFPVLLGNEPRKWVVMNMWVDIASIFTIFN